jgi:hypothetical protein
MLFSAEKGVTNGGTIVHCHRRREGKRAGEEGTIVHCEEGDRDKDERQREEV